MIEFPQKYVKELAFAISDSGLPATPKILIHTLSNSLVLLQAYCRDRGLTIHQVNLADFLEECDGFTSSIPDTLVRSVREIETKRKKDLIRERTKAGLATAKASGRTGGRPIEVSDAQIKQARELVKNRSITIVEVCKIIGTSRSTYYREIAPRL